MNIRVILLFSSILAMPLLWLNPTYGDYEPISLHELIGRSEFIVLGTISDVREHSFIVEDFDVVVGSSYDEPLEVKRFVDWSGSSRWTDYRAGQTVLLFLRESAGEAEGETQPWQIWGIGDEGEMPVADGFVYVHGPDLEDFSLQKFTVQQGTVYAYEFDLDTFISAVKGYKCCFSFVETKDGSQSQTILRLCDDEVLEIYRQKSELHRYLADESLKEIAESECSAPQKLDR